MDSIGDKLKKRFELFGNFLSGIIHPGNGTHKNKSHEILTSDKIYDDTGNRREGEVLEVPIGNYKHNAPAPGPGHEGLHSIWGRGPGERDENRYPNGPPSIQTQRRPLIRGFQGPEGFGFGPFGSMFSEFNSVVEEIEQSMKIMEKEITQMMESFPGENAITIDEDEDDSYDSDSRYFRFFGRPGPSSSGVIIEELPDDYDENSNSSNSRRNESKDSNYRNLMLKKADDRDGSQSQSIGTRGAGDGLVNRSIWDMLGLFSGGPQIDTETGTEPRVHTFSSFKMTGKRIHETPEGTEIITIRTDEYGKVHEDREFIPRKDGHGGGGFFRPKI